MLNLEEIIRPSILKLKAYSSARSLTNSSLTNNSHTNKSLSKNLLTTNENKPSAFNPTLESLSLKKGSNNDLNYNTIYLDANENFNAPDLFNVLPWESDLNRYPSPQPDLILKRFSEIYNVNPENILITRGSDEAIDILTRSVIEPNQDQILIQTPTYGMYQVSNDIQNGITLNVPLKFDGQTWTMDFENIEKTLKNNKVKIFYICNPNNPTGTLFSAEDIQKCLNLLPSSTLLVLDQAYIEFAENTYVKHKQLVILRTLSKSWGLAGLRLGCLIADPELIKILKKVIAPYPIPTAVAEFAIKALSEQNFEVMKEKVKKIIQSRNNLKNELLTFKCVKKIFPSSTNFLLIEFANSEIVMKQTNLRNIIIRDRSNVVPNCIRITVGSDEENQKLLQCLVEI